MIFIPRQNLVLDMLASLVPTRGPFNLYYKSKGEKCVLKKGLNALEELTLMREKFVRQFPPRQEGRYLGGSGS